MYSTYSHVLDHRFFLDNGWNIRLLRPRTYTARLLQSLGKTKIRTKFHWKEQKNYNKRRLWFHPPLTCSKATISIFLLIMESVFFTWLLRCNCAQKRNQYAPLKITCRIELILILSKTISFRHRQMAQQKAATPTQIKFLISFDWLENQLPNIWLIDLGGDNPVAMWMILQTILA